MCSVQLECRMVCILYFSDRSVLWVGRRSSEDLSTAVGRFVDLKQALSTDKPLCTDTTQA